MADTLTTNFGWTKPEIGGSPTTWGNKLNGTIDAIDAQAKLNADAAAADHRHVGEITMFAGATPPTGWLWCNGQGLSTTTYAALFAVIGYAFGGSGGTFYAPNFGGRGPLGPGAGFAMGATGGEATHALTGSEMPSHSHTLSDPGHTHALTDPKHTHVASAAAHTHAVNDPGHHHSNVITKILSGGWFGLGSASPLVTDTQNTGDATTGVTLASASPTVSITPAATGVTLASATAGITIGASGSGAAHNNLQPYCVVGFIIKAS